jgi:hypothetical protein
VAVFGCARAPTDEHLPDQETHAFLLAAGNQLPLAWIALCGHQVAGAEFAALDPGMGRPCRECHARWAASHRQGTCLPFVFPAST